MLMMTATTSLPSTSLVETCLPIESYFSERPQRSSNVMVRARVLDAQAKRQSALDRAQAKTEAVRR